MKERPGDKPLKSLLHECSKCRLSYPDYYMDNGFCYDCYMSYSYKKLKKSKEDSISRAKFIQACQLYLEGMSWREVCKTMKCSPRTLIQFRKNIIDGTEPEVEFK